LCEISNWTQLKVVELEGIKLSGGSIRFKNFFMKLAENKRINELRLVRFHSFVSFDYQSQLISSLSHFINLKRIVIQHDGFYLTHQFFNSVKNLINLEVIHVETMHSIDKAVDFNVLSQVNISIKRKSPKSTNFYLSSFKVEKN
jgi:hypothetical protein